MFNTTSSNLDTDTRLGLEEKNVDLREFKKTLIMNLKEGKICIDKIGKDSFNLVVENKIYALKELQGECENPMIERQIDHLESYLFMHDPKFLRHFSGRHSEGL